MRTDKIETIAREFSSRIEDEIGRKDLMTAATLNLARPDACVCYTQDFCDSNIHMHDAMTDILGRDLDLGDDDDCALWDEVWNLAIENRFYLTTN